LAKNKKVPIEIAAANSSQDMNLKQMKSEMRTPYIFLAARLDRNPKSLSRQPRFGKKRAFATAIIGKAPRFYVDIL
jgi:hypothetical protein